MKISPIDSWTEGREWYVRGMTGDAPRHAEWSFEAAFMNEKICVSRPVAVVDKDPCPDYMWVINMKFVYVPPETLTLPTYRLLLAGQEVSFRDTHILPDVGEPWPIMWTVGLKKSEKRPLEIADPIRNT